MNLEDMISEKARSIPPSAIRRFFDLANEMKDRLFPVYRRTGFCDSMGDPGGWNIFSGNG
jgi:hypothetical protein